MITFSMASCVTKNDGMQQPQCILCRTLFSNANLKPSKLDDLFKNRHGGRDSKNDIATKRARFDRASTLLTKICMKAEKTLLHATYQVVKSKKPHTIGEELIKPCALEMANTVLSKKATKKLQQLSLSNYVIHD